MALANSGDNGGLDSAERKLQPTESRSALETHLAKELGGLCGDWGLCWAQSRIPLQLRTDSVSWVWHAGPDGRSRKHASKDEYNGDNL